MFDLHQKVALVTGASRGLGWAMAQSLASAGAHVVLNARDGATLEGRVSELRALGLSGEAAAFDVNDSAAVEACVVGIVAREGALQTGFEGVSVERDVRAQVEAWNACR